MAKVVVVDDEPHVLEMVTAVLEASGHSVATYKDSPRALAELLDPARELPDLLVTDVMMPSLDGFELTRRLREDKRAAALPILVMSSHDEFRGRFAGVPGVRGFVQKPFDFPALRAALKAALGS